MSLDDDIKNEQLKALKRQKTKELNEALQKHGISVVQKFAICICFFALFGIGYFGYPFYCKIQEVGWGNITSIPNYLNTCYILGGLFLGFILIWKITKLTIGKFIVGIFTICSRGD